MRVFNGLAINTVRVIVSFWVDFVVQFSIFWGVLNKTIIPFTLVGYEILLKTGSLDNAIREFSLA